MLVTERHIDLNKFTPGHALINRYWTSALTNDLLHSLIDSRLSQRICLHIFSNKLSQLKFSSAFRYLEAC